MQAKRDQVHRAYRDGSGDRALELTEEIIDLIRAEELELLLAEQYENLGRVYWAMGDRARGEQWARRSLDLLEEQGYIGEVRPGMLRSLLRNYEEDVENSKHPSERGRVEEPELLGEEPRGDEGRTADEPPSQDAKPNEFRRRFEEEVAKLKAKMAADGEPTATRKLTPWKDQQAKMTGTPEQNQAVVEELRRKLKARLVSMKQNKGQDHQETEKAEQRDGEAVGGGEKVADAKDEL